jgi:BolA-like protein 3
LRREAETKEKERKMERVGVVMCRRSLRGGIRMGMRMQLGGRTENFVSSSSRAARPPPRISSSCPSARAYSATAAEPSTTTSRLEPPSHLDEKERAVFEQLVQALQPRELDVRDVSGGCGSMYAIEVASERFRGLGVLAQQRLVNKALEEEIGGWHGVQIRTRVP